MTQSLRYEYVEGPISAVREAWLHFVATRSPEPFCAAVRLVPAAGGCFLVVMPRKRPASLSLSVVARLGLLAGEPAVERALRRFKEVFEQGLCNEDGGAWMERSDSLLPFQADEAQKVELRVSG